MFVNDSRAALIDNPLAPRFLTINQTSGMTVSKNYTVISWNGSDTMSGIDHFEVKIDGESHISAGSVMLHNFTAPANGAHNVTVKAVDKAGHEHNKSITSQ